MAAVNAPVMPRRNPPRAARVVNYAYEEVDEINDDIDDADFIPSSSSEEEDSIDIEHTDNEEEDEESLHTSDEEFFVDDDDSELEVHVID
jgi:hypothetical protein